MVRAPDCGARPQSLRTLLSRSLGLASVFLAIRLASSTPAVAEELYEVRILSAAWLLFAISGLATLLFRGHGEA